MAARTFVATKEFTSAATSFASNAFTPNADDLLIVFVYATATAAAGSMTDSQGLGFTEVTTAARTSSANKLWCFVSNAKAANSSMTVTFDCTGDQATGARIFIYRVSGMSRVGASAIKQSAVTSNSGASKTATFGASALTGNVCLSLFEYTLGGGFSTTAPTSWTQDSQCPDSDFFTVGGSVAGRDSGETGTAIAWTGTTTAEFAIIIVELDTTAVTITGTAASTLDAVTHAATGNMQPDGTMSSTLASVTHDASGSETFTGTAASTLDSAAHAASGEEKIEGASASVLADVAHDASGTEAISGAEAATLGDVAHAASGAVANPVTGTAASTLDSATQSASGEEKIAGAAASTLGDVTQSASGEEKIEGAASSSLDRATSVAFGETGDPNVTGTAASTLDALAHAAEGTTPGPAVTGTAASTLGDVVQTVASHARVLEVCCPTSFPIRGCGQKDPIFASANACVKVNTLDRASARNKRRVNPRRDPGM